MSASTILPWIPCTRCGDPARPGLRECADCATHQKVIRAQARLARRVCRRCGAVGHVSTECSQRLKGYLECARCTSPPLPGTSLCGAHTATVAEVAAWKVDPDLDILPGEPDYDDPRDYIQPKASTAKNRLGVRP